MGAVAAVDYRSAFATHIRPYLCVEPCVRKRLQPRDVKRRRQRHDLQAAFATAQGRATAADAAFLQELAPVRRMIFTAADAAG